MVKVRTVIRNVITRGTAQHSTVTTRRRLKTGQQRAGRNGSERSGDERTAPSRLAEPNEACQGWRNVIEQ